MIRIVNIVTATRRGDAYDAVAINKYPIVMVGPTEELDELFKDDNFIQSVKSHLRNSTTYHHAKLYIRTLTDNYELSETTVKLSDVISLPDYE